MLWRKPVSLNHVGRRVRADSAMDRLTAQAISTLVEGSIAKLSESLLVAEHSLTAGEYASFKRDISLAIGRLSHDVLDPIYGQFPDLAPPGVL